LALLRTKGGFKGEDKEQMDNKGGRATKPKLRFAEDDKLKVTFEPRPV